MSAASNRHKSKVFQNPVAMNAIDPVAYFEQEKPVSDAAAHARHWSGAEWHFANSCNSKAFATNPQV